MESKKWKVMKRAFINDKGKLVIVNSNATMCDGETHTDIFGEFKIDAGDLMKIYGLLQDKQITCLCYLREDCFGTNNYMIVGENVENKKVMEEYVSLLKEVERLNETRHWWERKIKIERTL